MTETAVNTILSKAWENNSRALIRVRDRILFDISSEAYEWRTYEVLNILCIHSVNTNQECYLDVSVIEEIDLSNEPIGNSKS